LNRVCGERQVGDCTLLSQHRRSVDSRPRSARLRLLPAPSARFRPRNGARMALGSSLHVRVRTSNVVSLPRVGGLHHRYVWRQAAKTVSGPGFLLNTPPAPAERDHVPAGRCCRPFMRLVPRARARSRRPAPCPIPLHTPSCSRIGFWRPPAATYNQLCGVKQTG
jgi:hypothetical protein